MNEVDEDDKVMDMDEENEDEGTDRTMMKILIKNWMMKRLKNTPF